MPEVEDVPFRGPAAVEHLGGPALDDLPRRHQDRRVEVPLQRLAGSTRLTASSSGTRQSTPTTSAPASPIGPRARRC